MITKFSINGMHCASCKALIEDVSKDIPGVTACEVDMASGTASIEHDASVDMAAVQKEIMSLGDYKVDKIL